MSWQEALVAATERACEAYEYRAFMEFGILPFSILAIFAVLGLMGWGIYRSESRRSKT